VNRKVLVVAVVALVVLPLALFGCKGRVDKSLEEPKTEVTETAPQTQGAAITEPAQSIATETIPPTATPQMAEQKNAISQGKETRDKDIQRALANAGLYNGPIDGKIGPKTKKAISEFQKAKGLKADGKVGPKTWVELEKYLAQ